MKSRSYTYNSLDSRIIFKMIDTMNLKIFRAQITFHYKGWTAKICRIKNKASCRVYLDMISDDGLMYE